MNDLEQLRTNIDRYLLDEGLRDLVSEENKPRDFEVKSAITWILFQIVVVSLATYLSDTLFDWAALVSYILLILLVSTGIRVLFGLVAKWFDTQIKSIPVPRAIKIYAGLLLLSAIPAAVLGRLTGAITTTIIYVLLYILVARFIDGRSMKVPLRAVTQASKAAFQATLKAMNLSLSLLPILLVLVVLSIFSQELWQVMGSMSIGLVTIGALLIFIPAYIAVVWNGMNKISTMVKENSEQSTVEKNRIVLECIKDIGVPWNRINEVKYQDLMTWELSQKKVEEKVRRWLMLLFTITSISLISLFSTYFLLLLNVLLPEKVLSIWLKDIPSSSGITHTILGVSVYLFDGPVGTVAIFFGFLMGSQALIQTDVTNRLQETLKELSGRWLAASSLKISSLELSEATKSESEAKT